MFDFPGQVELFTHHSSVKHILNLLQKWGHRIVTVHLTDAHYCSDPGKYVSVLITALSTMIQLETPHINILSKADLLGKFGALPFKLEYFTEVMDLNQLLDLLNDDSFFRKYKDLSKAICGVVQDFNLVNFLLLDVTRKESMVAVLQAADQANGYCFYETDSPDIRKLAAKSGNPENDPAQKYARDAEQRLAAVEEQSPS